MTLVELVPSTPAGRPARYALTIGSVLIEFGDDFSDETLRRVLRVVRSC